MIALLRIRHQTLALLGSFMLAACGGGGSSSPPPTANAGAAQSVVVGATVTLDGSASTDSQGSALSYSWALTTKPTGSASSLISANTAKPSFKADLPGSYVATLTVNNGSVASAPASVAITALPVDGLNIVLDKTEPLTGDVKLSLSGPTGNAQVVWSVDRDLIGIGPSLTWDSTRVTNGAHELKASIQIASNGVKDILRTVTVTNRVPDITIFSYVSGTTGSINVDITPRSAAYVITSVAASLDGGAATTLTSPNACDRMPCLTIPPSIYRFNVDATAVGSGTHLMLVTVKDSGGHTEQVSVAVPVSNAPVITPTAPVDGAIVFGSLKISGSVKSDKAGAVTLKASLGDVSLLQTTGPDFSTSYDLTGKTPGSYTLTLQATDGSGTTSTVQRTVVVASSGALAYAPGPSFGVDGQLLAVDGDQMLYATADKRVLLRDTVTGTEVPLQTAGTNNGWQVSGGMVYASGIDTDCTVTGSCIYQWRADGTRVNLTSGDPRKSFVQQFPMARDGYVLWSNAGFGFTLYNVASGTYTLIPSTSGRANGDFDLSVSNGVATVFYTDAPSSSTNTATDLYQWSSVTPTATLVASPAYSTKTDGSRLAWSQPSADPNSGTVSLYTRPFAGGTPTLASATALVGYTMLRDGVMAWFEQVGTGRLLKASTGTTTSPLSPVNAPMLYGVGGGFVTYSAQGKTYAWNSLTGASTLLLDAVPTSALQSGSTLYFTLGASQTAYKVRLN